MIFFNFLSILFLILGIALILVLEYFNQSRFHPYVSMLAMVASAGSFLYYLLFNNATQFFGITGQNLDYSTALLVQDQFTIFFALVLSILDNL